jgi:endonuclease/exonuclease/phosphatase family metal-dependent hydrolase
MLKAKVIFIVQLITIIYLGVFQFLILDFWFFDLLSYLMLKVLILHLFLMLYVLFFNRYKWFWLVNILAVLVAIKPFSETFAINKQNGTLKSDFTVMNYNVAWFDFDRNGRLYDSTKTIEMYNWFRTIDMPDILCLQEFYHSETETYGNNLDSIAALGNYPYYYLNPIYSDDFGGIIGNVIFSRFPSIQSKQIKYSNSVVNRGNFHDFLVKNDTIRVLNVHMASMHIRLKNEDSLSIFDNFSFNFSNILSKLQSGYKTRKDELKKIGPFFENSPYKTIICGDFNAIPYSYTYQKIKKTHYNAFEKKGFDFGFTYHHFPWLIRIDNQFYDKNLILDFYKTHHSNTISDHYPISAGYSFKQRERL